MHIQRVCGAAVYVVKITNSRYLAKLSVASGICLPLKQRLMSNLHELDYSNFPCIVM